MNDFIDSFRVEGKILLHGQDLYASNINPVNVRLAVGMVFQKPNPFPKTIYDNIALGPKLAKYKQSLDELVENSLKQAIYGMRLKTNYTKVPIPYQGGNNNVYV